MSAPTREWAPKWADPGTALVWTDHQDAHLWGTVWSAGPVTGSRWCTLSDGSLALVKVGMSGRHAGTVEQLVRRDRDWQRTVVRALDRLASARGLRVSDHERWVSMGPYSDGITGPDGHTSRWVRWHVADCEHAERSPQRGEGNIRHDDGTVTYCGLYRPHAWLLAMLAHPNEWDRLDLCECITG